MKRAYILLFTVVAFPWGQIASSDPTGGKTEHATAQSISALVSALTGPDRDARRVARRALVQIGDAAVPALLEALEHGAPEMRLQAVRVLSLIAPESAEAVAALTRRLGDADADVRFAAARALAAMAPIDRPAVLALGAALSDPSKHVRLAAARALQDVDARAVVTELIAATADGIGDVRLAAIEALCSAGPAAVAELVAALGESPRARIRKSVATALGCIGRDADATLPQLLQALSDPDEDVRYQAAVAVAAVSVDPSSTVGALVTILDRSDVAARRSAAIALAEMAPSAEPAVPALLTALRDPDDDLRAAAARAVSKIAPTTDAAVAALIAALRDPIADVRFTAVAALKRIAPASEPAIPALIDVVASSDREHMPAIIYTAIQALGAFGPAAQAAVPVLSKLLAESTNIYKKTEAAWALGQIGAAEGLPALTAALQDQNWQVVKQARRSIASIEQALGGEGKSAGAARDPCAQGCEDTIIYRCECPTAKVCKPHDGTYWCCDYVCRGTTTAGAMTTCQRFCRQPWGVCKASSVDALSPKVLGKALGKNLVAVGEANVNGWIRSTADARGTMSNRVDVPDPRGAGDRWGDFHITARDVEVHLQPGTQLGGTTFMAAPTKNNVYVKRCDKQLRRTVIELLSGRDFFKQLANAAAGDESVRNELNRQIQRQTGQ